MIVIPDEGGPQSPLKSPATLTAPQPLPASPPPYPTASTQPMLRNQSSSQAHHDQAPQNSTDEYEAITLYIPRILVPANDEPSVKARMRFLVSLGVAMLVFIVLSAFFSSVTIPRHGRWFSIQPIIEPVPSIIPIPTPSPIYWPGYPVYDAERPLPIQYPPFQGRGSSVSS